jgi:hypothetical protein
VVWLFANRSFAWDRKTAGKPLEGKDLASDREALRVHDRFSITSWPQMVVFDPRDFRVLEKPPRSVEGVVACFTRACGKVPKAGPEGKRLARILERAEALHAKGKRQEAEAILKPLARARDRYGAWREARRRLDAWRGPQQPQLTERLVDPDPRTRVLALEQLYLDRLEKKRTRAPLAAPLEKAIRSLLLNEQEDPVVRLRALWILAEARPEIVAQEARTLLQVPIDPFRYRVLETLARSPDPDLGPDLIRIFEGAGKEVPSQNPNILRIKAVQALEACGDARCVPVLATVARAADARNSLTSMVIQTLSAVARRGDRAHAKKVAAILLESFPEAVGPDALKTRPGQWMARRHLALAAKVAAGIQAIRGKKKLPDLPQAWTSAERDAYLKKLRRVVK